MIRAVLIFSAIIIFGAMIITPFGPARVISGSMEPEIRTGSTIFLMPAKEIILGDVIVFHPDKLDSELIVHRVVEKTPEGFITRGDATSLTDQERGEPPVTKERIAGKVLVIHNKIPQIEYSTFIKLVMGLCAVLGISWAVSGAKFSKKRLRVKHIQSFALVVSIIAVFFTAILGSGAQSVSYLSSQNPGSRTDHIKVGEPGEMEFRGRNRSLIPALVYVEGPVCGTVQLVLPFSEFETTVEIPARDEIGWYEISIKQYTYPVAMPPHIIDFLYRVSPYLAMIVVASFTILLIYLTLRIVEPWLPLSMLGGKRLSRSYRRFKRSLIS